MQINPRSPVSRAAAAPRLRGEGLLTVLMRLVFILYAEDRDLLPSPGLRGQFSRGESQKWVKNTGDIVNKCRFHKDL